MLNLLRKRWNRILDPAEIYALKLLTGREHSRFELRRKLQRKGYTDLEIIPLLDKLKNAGWQNDLRFAKAYTSSRQSRGYGPLRVQKELNERGIDEEIMNAVVDEQADEWIEVLAKIGHRKFGCALSVDFAERAKQFRFLYYKGFSGWHIKEWLKKL
jgi:regulatory protein